MLSRTSPTVASGMDISRGLSRRSAIARSLLIEDRIVENRIIKDQSIEDRIIKDRTIGTSEHRTHV